MTILDQVLSDIEAESNIDELRIEFELLRIPQIQSRFMNMFTRQSIALRRLQGEYDSLKKDRVHYYLGKAPDAEYVKDRLDIKVLKTDLDLYLAADPVLTAKSLALQEQKLAVEALEKFLSSLRQRGYDLKTAVDYMKFKAGA